MIPPDRPPPPPPSSAKPKVPEPCIFDAASRVIEILSPFPKWKQERIIAAVATIFDIEIRDARL